MKRLSRREFGKVAMGSLSSLTLASTARVSAKRAASSVFGGVQIGVMTYSFRDRPLDKALENIVDLGFSSVELYSSHLDPLKASDKEIKFWKRKFADAGVKIASYYVNFGKNPTDEQIDRCFRGGKLLGTGILSSSVTKGLVPRLDRACQKFKMRLGLHNHWFHPPDSNQFESPQDFLDALKNSSKWMSITLDVGHFYAARYDPVRFIREHHDRIVSLHLKDRGNDPEHIDHPFGQGSTPLIQVVQLLKEIQFNHAANIEWEVQNSDPVQGVADGLEYFKRALA